MPSRNLPVQLDLIPVKHAEIDGIEMGVLSDGTPYLTARGLSRLCGVAPSAIITISSDWKNEVYKPRGVRIAELLAAQNYDETTLFIKTKHQGTEVHAHPDAVCMAILEYYAFEADRPKEQALLAYRLLARQSLRQFIYNRVGFDPNNQIPDSWRQYHDRLILNDFPLGFFSVFRETADIVISAIQHGLVVDDHTVPDISIGKTWSSHWTKNNFDQQYGQRKKHPHTYPDYFPQAAAGPVDAWVYPNEALAEFRRWVRTVYMPEKFPTYLNRKVETGAFPPSRAELLLSAFTPEDE